MLAFVKLKIQEVTGHRDVTIWHVLTLVTDCCVVMNRNGHLLDIRLICSTVHISF